MMDIETLAKELHEAGREAVEKGATVAAEKFGEKTRIFLGWDEITEAAREGRRIQARYLLERYEIYPFSESIANLLAKKMAAGFIRGDLSAHFRKEPKP